MTTKPTGKRIDREAHLKWIPLAKMQVNPLAQRELNRARVNKLASEMELEQFGNQDQSVQCWTYDGENALTEEEEAEVFLKLNDTLTVATFEKFRIAVKSGRPEEVDIDRIVRAQGLRISRQHGNGAIQAVATLRKVYRMGPAVLARSLGIIRDAYGDAGLDVGVIEGIGLLCSRYNGELSDAAAVERLGKARAGIGGLRNSAEDLRLRTGWPRAHCVAATVVTIYNRGKGGKKLQTWARSDSS